MRLCSAAIAGYQTIVVPINRSCDGVGGGCWLRIIFLGNDGWHVSQLRNMKVLKLAESGKTLYVETQAYFE